MILTITLNPSVDISYHLPNEFKLDAVNRVENISKTAGGKGLNVSRVLKQLGDEVAATGFLGGSLGELIRQQLADMGVEAFFVPISGETRNCIAILHEGKQTEILEGGPRITPMEADLFLKEMRVQAKSADYITISGSLPQGLATSYYNEILDISNGLDTPVLLDTKGDLLKNALQNDSKPYLIKPNLSELSDLTGKELLHETAVAEALQSGLFADVPWVVVTLGSNGAVIKNESNFYFAEIPRVEAVNPVGSGDSVIAGFASGFAKGFKDDALIKYGISMGVLNALQEKTGFINPAKIDWCIQQIKIKKI